MIDLINEMSELIYVVDIDTYDLLFVNQSGKEIFSLDDISGMKCYRALQGKKYPCEFCTNSLLKPEQFITWEYTNPLVHRHYLLKDKLIDWEGKKARVEIAVDTTDGEIEKINLRNTLAAENLVTKCAQILFADSYEKDHVDDVLSIAGSFLESDRAYIFEINGNTMSNTYEWCAKGIEPQIEQLQDMPVTLIKRWQDAFKRQECVLIEDVEQVGTENADEYEELKRQGIRSMIAVPIYSNNTLSGYIGVDNYTTQKLANAQAILGSIGYFVGAKFEIMKSLHMLEQLSYYDSLTDLGNRNKFNLDISRIPEQGSQPVGIIYLDINGMKRMNDEYGHNHGDIALIHTGNVIGLLFPDDYLYRIGGDEFVVICQGICEKSFETKVRELRQSFMSEKEYSVSIGKYWSEDNKDIRSVLFRADELMYQDKKEFYRGRALSGRYRHGLDDVLNLTKPGVLTKMIEDNKFPVYYQPKVSPNTYVFIGAEALVRCEISPGNIIQPNNFIPILEESRLISVLDFHIFRMVNAQIKKWMCEGRRIIPVSVNFSRYTLSEHNFLNRIKEIWSEYQVPKQFLEIEVTETVEEDDRFDFIELMKKIKQEGFSISIDDFGIKNANLSLFTSMDFDILKIDKCLVHNLAHNEKAQAVLYSISNLCRKMGIQMIVEGVETEEQLKLLQQIRCDGIQGYLFSPPVPLGKFEEHYI